MSEKLLLQILDEIHGLKDEQKSTNQRLDRMDERFIAIDEHFDQIDERFVAIDDRFNQIDENYKVIDERLSQLELKTDAVQEQTAKLSEYHAETTIRLKNMASSDDIKYLKELVFKHDEEIYKLKSQQQHNN
ncbi:hypothetical protein [Gracilibacillus salinarum]|uniref:t-SNARE coiled-coil homology domain-containing protein n=1 Tax=Gracilibacillus salinarum TaxID=2932255 RepID=A0ABY4GGP1_9BACI|nr:hypothetical protein [Gracilibacillus salinarum]UOQ83488.1 hypothetical protein MUN87_12015 [Gracilibacillus salinarum]